jgi:hypothetical protein
VLSGDVEGERAGLVVVILARPHGRARFHEIGRARTRSGGRWSFTARPAIRTVYRARVGRLQSGPIVVEVAPRIVLRGRQGRFTARVRAARSVAGKYVVLQRRAGGRPWQAVRRLILNDAHSTSFTFPHPRGRTEIRLVMPRSQVGPGYVTGTSAVFTLIGR